MIQPDPFPIFQSGRGRILTRRILMFKCVRCSRKFQYPWSNFCLVCKGVLVEGGLK